MGTPILARPRFPGFDPAPRPGYPLRLDRSPTLSTTTSAPLSTGTRLAHYEVREVLGSGGMGTVYLAYDTALDRLVAVKVLKSEVAGDPDLVDRFVREARAAARVSHSNLTHVYFVGTAEGKPFFAMEHCPGSTLEARVREKGPLGLAEGLDVLVQASRGLAAVHTVGVVHRDVKPSNLMLLPDGTVKVTDFGLSKSLSGDVMATAGRIMGTPAYMSPEQVRGKPVDARTDVYLLGLTAHFVFTGKPAWASEAVGEVIHDQLSTPLPSVTEGREHLPPALDEVLAKLCAKDPEQRPATMQEVARLLEGLRPRPIDPAPFLARAVAYAVDFAVILGLGLVVGLLLWLVRYLTGGMPAASQFLSGAGSQMALALGMLGASLFVAVFAERRFGTTPGKLLLGMGVVRVDGTPAGLRPLVLRFLLRYPVFLAVFPSSGWSWADLVFWCLQGVAVFVGILCYFFSQGRTLSDLITGTRVVYRLRGGGRTRP